MNRTNFQGLINFFNGLNSSLARVFGRGELAENQAAGQNPYEDRFRTPPTRSRSARQRADRVNRIRENFDNDTMIVSNRFISRLIILKAVSVFIGVNLSIMYLFYF